MWKTKNDGPKSHGRKVQSWEIASRPFLSKPLSPQRSTRPASSMQDSFWSQEQSKKHHADDENNEDEGGILVDEPCGAASSVQLVGIDSAPLNKWDPAAATGMLTTDPTHLVFLEDWQNEELVNAPSETGGAQTLVDDELNDSAAFVESDESKNSSQDYKTVVPDNPIGQAEQRPEDRSEQEDQAST